MGSFEITIVIMCLIIIMGVGGAIIIAVIVIRQKEKIMDDKIELENERVKLKSEQLKEKIVEIEQKNIDITFREKELEFSEIEMHKKIQKMEKDYEDKLTEITGESVEEVKKQILKHAEEKYKNLRYEILKKNMQQLELEEKQLATDILLQAMENSAIELTNEVSVVPIKLKEDDIKGKFIGKEGRNIKLIENLLQVNLIIDDTPNVISISSLNPLRRAVAQKTIEELLINEVINQATIEEVYEKNQKKINDLIYEKGNEAIDILNIHNFSKELINLIGIMHFRTSYGQNLLQHSIETAQIAGSIAAELNLDGELAKKCALLHDIGKIESQQTGESHDILGAQIISKYLSDEIIINAIISHHNYKKPETPYAIITQIADSISASRKGVRRNYYDNYVTRIANLEEIAQEVKGVKTAFALNGGKELRIIVETGLVKDIDMELLGEEVREKIVEKTTFPGVIKISVIKETRYITEAKKNGDRND